VWRVAGAVSGGSRRPRRSRRAAAAGRTGRRRERADARLDTCVPLHSLYLRPRARARRHNRHACETAKRPQSRIYRPARRPRLPRPTITCTSHAMQDVLCTVPRPSLSATMAYLERALQRRLPVQSCHLGPRKHHPRPSLGHGRRMWRGWRPTRPRGRQPTAHANAAAPQSR